MAFLHIEKEENNRSSPKACSFSEQEDFQILQDVLINRKKNETNPLWNPVFKNHL